MGLKSYIEKYFFIKTKMEYLSFWVTRYGFKPIDKNNSKKQYDTANY